MQSILNLLIEIERNPLVDGPIKVRAAAMREKLGVDVLRRMFGFAS